MMDSSVFFAQTPNQRDVSSRSLVECPTDTLSDVLEIARLRGQALFTCALSSPFGIAFPAGMRLLHIVESGPIMVKIAQVAGHLRLSRGDVLLVPHGHAHAISDREGRPLQSLQDAVPADFQTGRKIGDGDQFQWLCGSFQFDDVLADRLLRVLPPAIVLRGIAGQRSDWLEQGCRFALREALNPLPGARVMISRLLDVMFVQILRSWATGTDARPGWLSAALDPRIGKALAAIHAQPSRSWTVDELAKIVGLSRSAFSGQFSRLVGQTPISYVSDWQLNRASELLRFSLAPIAKVAFSVGYESEAAFSRAFKARFGSSPLHWRRAAAADPDGTRHIPLGPHDKSLS